MAALVGDNCSANKAFATRVCCGFVGCASQRYNLAMKDILEEEQIAIQKVRELMLRFRNPIPGAKLRKHTDLTAKCSNATQWSSTIEMIRRYV